MTPEQYEDELKADLLRHFDESRYLTVGGMHDVPLAEYEHRMKVAMATWVMMRAKYLTCAGVVEGEQDG